MKKLLQLTIALCASFAMFGCMAMKPLNADPTQLRDMLKKGDHVEVLTASGQQMELDIDTVDDTGMQGSGQRIAYTDIRSISRKQIDAGHTTLVVLGIVAAGAVAAAAGGGGSGSGY